MNTLFRLVSGSLAVLILVASLLPAVAFADDAAKKVKESAPKTETTAEEADVEKIKEKYWARGNEAEVGVVQNRLFTKKHKIQLGVSYDTIYGDPFLSTRAVTATAGYHFNEYYSAHLIFSNIFVGPSNALTTLERENGTTANTNEPKWYLASELHANVLYGKVSLLGMRILHFDAYVSGGVGVISTESGKNFLALLGIGQLLHITKTVGLSLGYKLLWYRESILGKTTQNLGQYLGTRSNLSSMMTIGVTFMLDPMPEEKPLPAK